MLLNVRHVTQYVYDEPVRESVMEVWMQPLRTLTQTPISFELSVDPAVKAFNYADVYGNQVHHFDVPQPHNTLRIESHATVETVAATPLPAALGLEAWDQLVSESVRGDCWDFLRPDGFTTGSPALDAFVQGRGLQGARWRRLQSLRQSSRDIAGGLDAGPHIRKACRVAARRARQLISRISAPSPRPLRTDSTLRRSQASAPSARPAAKTANVPHRKMRNT